MSYFSFSTPTFDDCTVWNGVWSQQYDGNTKTYYTLKDIEVYQCSSDGPLSYGDIRAEFKIEETDNFITTIVIPESREVRNKKRIYKFFKDTGDFYELK